MATVQVLSLMAIFIQKERSPQYLVFEEKVLQAFTVFAKLLSCFFRVFIVKNQAKLRLDFAITMQNQVL
ncbi:hypothetical protein GNF10_28315 [Nostoc sp. UCD121]|uniref:hypothetical protein n=1 Tax=unclassified Nostoc TaxID=2593658 RepID=UPI00162697B0|nr:MULTISPECIES: hypothetical protein [unclassified Nostoc]MBC1279755.1 hypothetical protein [Nostoc sp. UCD121]MBC1297903.1 hypothetical protein [Nostoc sp. UCD122]